MLAVTFANESINQTTQMVQNINWTAPTWDLFILAGWALASVVYAFAAGRGRIINILLSVYIAKLLVLQMPFLTNSVSERLSGTAASLQQMIVFLVLFLVLFLLLGRFVLKTSADSHRMSSAVFGLIFSFLQIGMLINIVLKFLPLITQESFSPLIRTLFIKDPVSLIWLVAPIIYLVILGKFVGHSHEM